MSDHKINPMRPDQWAEVLDLLASGRLPEAGLSRHQDRVRVATDHTGVVGCVALERCGALGLLRSLAVRSDRQGTGLGGQLVQTALGLAVSDGITDVFLLTETAESFFARKGFVPVSRDQVPQEIQSHVEFAEACPASATVMRLPLTDS